jgi:hypothetical protein
MVSKSLRTEGWEVRGWGGARSFSPTSRRSNSGLFCCWGMLCNQSCDMSCSCANPRTGRSLHCALSALIPSLRCSPALVPISQLSRPSLITFFLMLSGRASHCTSTDSRNGVKCFTRMGGAVSKFPAGSSLTPFQIVIKMNLNLILGHVLILFLTDIILAFFDVEGNYFTVLGFRCKSPFVKSHIPI